MPFTEACRRCGAIGEPVCTEPAAPALCNDGLMAEDGVCVEACGAFGEEPCEDTGCEAGGFDAASPRGNSGIADGVCVSSCGEPSWRCCDADDTGARCFQPNFACIAEEGVDGQGVPFTAACRPCGSIGEPVCTEPTAPAPCNDGLMAEDGVCVEEEVMEVACGALGEVPCDGAPFFLCCFASSMLPRSLFDVWPVACHHALIRWSILMKCVL